MSSWCCTASHPAPNPAQPNPQVLSARELSLVGRYVLGDGKALVIAANKMDALPGEEERQLYLSTLRACLVRAVLRCACCAEPQHAARLPGACCAVLCCAVLCCAMLCCVVLCCAVHGV